MRDKNKKNRMRMRSELYGVPQEEENITKIRKARRKQTQKRMAAFVCVVALGLAVALNWDTLSPAALMNDLEDFTAGFGPGDFPVSYAQGSFADAVPVGSGFGVLTDSAFVLYARNGRQLALRQHGMASPCLASSGSRAIVFDDGGTQYKVESGDGSYSGTASDGIIAAAVNSGGYYAVVTKSVSYLSVMSVYSPAHKRIFEWFSSGGRIISVALNRSGTRAAAVTLSAKNGAIVSTLHVYDLSQKNPVAETNYTGEFLLSVQYNNSGSISAVGQNHAYLFNSGGRQTAVYSYADRTLKCFVNSPAGAALVFSRYGVGSQSKLVSLNQSGGVAGSANITREVRSLSTDGSHIAVLCTGKILYYGNGCGYDGSRKISGNIQKLLCLGDRTYLFSSSAVYEYATE